MADEIPYISYAVKYPDTNKLGVEDIFISEHDTSLEQTRGVLNVTVRALNATTLPMGGGDNTSIASKVATLDERYKAIKLDDFKEGVLTRLDALDKGDNSTDSKLGRLDSKLVTAVEDTVNTLKEYTNSKVGSVSEAFNRALDNATTAIYHEFRTIGKAVEKRLLYLEDVICKVEKQFATTTQDNKLIKEAIGNLQQEELPTRVKDLEAYVNNLRAKEQKSRGALVIFREAIASNAIVVTDADIKQELITALNKL